MTTGKNVYVDVHLKEFSGISYSCLVAFNFKCSIGAQNMICLFEIVNKFNGLILVFDDSLADEISGFVVI